MAVDFNILLDSYQTADFAVYYNINSLKIKFYSTYLLHICKKYAIIFQNSTRSFLTI